MKNLRVFTFSDLRERRWSEREDLLSPVNAAEFSQAEFIMCMRTSQAPIILDFYDCELSTDEELLMVIELLKMAHHGSKIILISPNCCSDTQQMILQEGVELTTMNDSPYSADMINRSLAKHCMSESMIKFADKKRLAKQDDETSISLC